jgi:ABC-type siderophore export system fused ATPase/permease subunit
MLEKFLNKIKIFNLLKKAKSVKTELENSEDKIIITQEEWLRIKKDRSAKEYDDFIKKEKLKKEKAV